MQTPTKLRPGCENSINVLVSAAFYTPAYRGGGPIQTLKALISSAPPRYNTRIICTNHDLGTTSPLTEHPNQWVKVDNANVRYVQGGFYSQFKALRETREAELIYLNSLFSPRYSIIPLTLKLLGLWRNGTILLAPRGELDPEVLMLKAHKKTAFLTAFKIFRMHKRVLWHASTEAEAAHIKSAFQGATVLVRENETSLPQLASMRDSRKPGAPRILFASRLVENKGLHILLEALHDVTESIELKVIGAFEDSKYEKRCRELLKSMGDNISVELIGPTSRESVLQAMYEADLMAFPTAAENFGHVIPEALSQSCPVICSANTPWTQFLDNGGGGSVKHNIPEAWAEAIQAFVLNGPKGWEAASSHAGETFNRWRSMDKGTHIFELAIGKLAES